ncbi:hypothetical protein F5878DRAFT_137969 [Lentinula raphanica]|uniref:Uncharacterized protein n=1 Tax=Lentinula raphanica TaxID=153919 RepID=A0AA38PJZ9_9AGAR|nr:hypothetical protein F5878DRAFT_137969 [Lentinula raphanica]
MLMISVHVSTQDFLFLAAGLLLVKASKDTQCNISHDISKNGRCEDALHNTMYMKGECMRPPTRHASKKEEDMTMGTETSNCSEHGLTLERPLSRPWKRSEQS